MTVIQLTIKSIDEYYRLLAHWYEITELDIARILVLKSVMDVSPIAVDLVTHEEYFDYTLNLYIKTKFREALGISVSKMENWLTRMRKKNVIDAKNQLAPIFKTIHDFKIVYEGSPIP
jgi:hypothetical protein